MTEEVIGCREPLGEGLYNMWLTEERIVRCKDCVYKRKAWNGRHPAFVDGCFCAYFGGVEKTDQSGFCSWGELRNEQR